LAAFDVKYTLKFLSINPYFFYEYCICLKVAAGIPRKIEKDKKETNCSSKRRRGVLVPKGYRCSARVAKDYS
jgi:hypothetical protein